MKKVIASLFISSVIFVFVACSSSSTDTVAPTTTTTTTGTTTTGTTTGTTTTSTKVTFATVNPIFVASCSGSGCHNTTESPVFVNNYIIAKAFGTKIVSQVVSKQMPKNGSLTTDQIATIKQWQTDGFLEK